MKASIPKKRGILYPEQCNVRIEPELKDDLDFLDSQGVDIAELLRPVIRAEVRRAKKEIISEKEILPEAV